MKNDKRNLHTLMLGLLTFALVIALLSLPAFAAQPDTITVDVFQYDVNGAEVHCGTYILTQTDNWYLKIPAMDKYDANGDPYKYVVVEQSIDGYISTVYSYDGAPADYSFIVVNQEIRTVTFDGNGGTVLPANEKRTVASGSALGSNMPPNPTQSGYTFKNWNTKPDGSGTVFTSATLVTDSMTVFAQWNKNTGGGGGGTGGRNEYGTAEIVDEEPDVIIVVSESPVTAEWALMNLILSISGAVLAIVMFIRTFQQRYVDERRNKTQFLWMFTALVMGTAGLVLFILTQDMSQVMVWFDKWTIANAMLFIAVAGCLMTTIKRKQKNDPETSFKNEQQKIR
jgi:uncharacterized repeat protein (TIGR02543 family)